MNTYSYNTSRFRFDDVCVNANMGKANDMAKIIRNKFPSSEILFGISPLVHDMSEYTGVTSERIFPKILNAYSDWKKFYNVDICGCPDIISEVSRASHGLVHVDHRLLSKSAQEMSILVSCSLTKSNIFIPPFNKWNTDTDDICQENGIELIKFEDGWLCMEYNSFDPSHNLWYVHSREFELEEFKKWIM